MNIRNLAVVAVALAATPQLAKAFDADDANGKCRGAIVRLLSNPDAAKFGDRNALEVKPGVWVVMREVTGTNGFGGVVTQRFYCRIENGAVVKVVR